MVLAYDEFIDFLAGGSTPQDVIDYVASQFTNDQVEFLISKQKTESLTSDENSELQNYLQVEHMMRMAKARTRRKIASH